MHMADALISPEVGGVMWTLSAGVIVYSSAKVKKSLDDFKVPLMGVMGAFIFAAQMINFSIPGTGSSGHIVGSLFLSIILGPYAALLVISSVLVVQSLIFADGGLLALGCNIFNMGIIPCFIAYPLVYRLLTRGKSSLFKLWAGALAASVIGLQIGAFSVVMETCLSGISELPFKGFLLMMLPIHLAIGFVEGIITASLLVLIKNARPELLSEFQQGLPVKPFPLRSVLLFSLGITLLIAGVVSWFASENPDGLEWAIADVTQGKDLENPDVMAHSTAAEIQSTSAILPDYGFKSDNESNSNESSWGSVNLGTSLSGIAGAVITLLVDFQNRQVSLKAEQ